MPLPINFPVPFTTTKSAANRFSSAAPMRFATSKPAANRVSTSVPKPFTTTKPSVNRFSTSVPSKFQLNSTTSTANLGSITEQNQQNNRFSTGVPSKFQLNSTTSTTNLSYTTEQNQQNRKKSQTNEGDSKKLNGFDVLRALEKATASKMKKKRNGRDNSLLLSRKLNEKGRKGTIKDEDLEDYGNKIVRPLNVKEDWGTCLDELEKRLEELVDTAAA